MSINTRIAELIKAFGYAESAFAKHLGVSSSVMFNIVNPKGRLSYPSGPVLEKILSLTHEGQRVSAEWLMRGEGSMWQVAHSYNSAEEALAYLAEKIKSLEAKSEEK